MAQIFASAQTLLPHAPISRPFVLATTTSSNKFVASPTYSISSSLRQNSSSEEMKMAASHLRSNIIARAASTSQETAQSSASSATSTLLCTSLTAATVEGMLEEAAEAVVAGADVLELRLDYLDSFNVESDLPELLSNCPLPAIVTYRPHWEGGKYTGAEAPRLATLKYAAALGAAFVDIELKVADIFFSSPQVIETPTRFIVSSHDYQATPSEADLDQLVQRCKEAGADIVKFATTALDISDAARVLRVLQRAVAAGQPTIALAMAERGQITRILAPKYGGFLTFGALSPERQSAPGQPTLAQLRQLFHLQNQHAGTKVFGIVGNPVSHSKSPALHNAAMAEINFDGVYVPLLVDDMASFLAAFADDPDWAGLSVTIPHKEAALKAAASSDAVATAIGAANTLIRQQDGTFKAFNTDWMAAISAIERGLGGSGSEEDAENSPLKGKTVVVVGAGGAGRAVAFGAASRGAHVVIANRSAARAVDLAAQITPPARGVDLQEVASGAVYGDVLVNTTSVGMHPLEDATPVPASALGAYTLVFDAVYTPLQTRLLREAAHAGCAVVTGDEMFVGQAAAQFELFTGVEGEGVPVELMRRVVLGGGQ